MTKDLTSGSPLKVILMFTFPLVLGNLFQQFYALADTIIVGRFVGTRALAAVGSAFTLMTFLTSILLGLAMGSGTVFSIKYGQKDDAGLKEGILASFVLLAGVTAVLVFAVYAGFNGIIWFLRIPAEIDAMMRTYLRIVFAGLAATFLYNYFASLLRALGSAVCGAASLGAVNLLAGYTGVSIALNYATAFVAVVLGAPGVVTMLLLRVLLLF